MDGRLAGDEVTQPEYWLRKVLEPVRFAAGMRTLEADGVTAYVEIGPHPVLLGMGRQCVSDEGGALWLPSLRKDAKAWPTLLGSVGELYTAGGEIDWKAFDAPYARQRVTAPSYPFGGRRYWISDGPGARPSAEPATTEAAAQAYTLAWRSAPALTPPAAAAGGWLVLADAGGFGSTLVRALEDLGGRCTVVFAGDRFVDIGHGRYQVDPASSADLEGVLDATADLRGIVNLWPLDVTGNDAVIADAHRLIEQAVHLGRLAIRRGTSRPARMWFVTSNAVVAGQEPASLSVAQAPLWGLGRTLALEHPDLWGGLIDLGTAAGPRDAAAIAAQLVSGGNGGNDDQVALRGGERYVPRLTLATAEPVGEMRFSDEAIHLVTGGFGAIGRRLAQWLAARGARHIALTSRRGDATPGARELARDLDSRGVKVYAIAADVGDATGVDKLFTELTRTGRPLGAVFHVAGVDQPQPFAELDPPRMREVLAPKIDGAWRLHERSHIAGATHFVCFSSISSVLGSAGRAHYAAANAFLDALSHERHRAGLPSLSVNWGPWSGGGMASDEVLRQFERIGNYGLDPDQAVRQLETQMQSGAVQVSVARIDWTKFRMVYEARGPKPMLSQIVPDGSTATASEGAADLAPWIDALTQVPAAQRERELAAMLQREVADTLGFEDADSVALDRTFQDMGMDSLMSAEFARRLNKQLGIRSTALVFQHPTAGALAHALIEQVNAATVASPSPAPAAQGAAVVAPAESTGVAVASGGNPIAGYSADTEPLVFAFQRQAWPDRREDLIAPRWRWMFVESARRLGLEPRVWLYRDNGRVVGHNGAIPVRLKIGQAELDTAWLVDTMVLEEFRSQAVGSRLMLQSDEDLPLALSLGQTSQMREIQLRLGWEQVAPLQTAQLLIRPERVLKGKLPAPAAAAAGLGLRAAFAVRDVFKSRPKARVREIASFDARHDALWDRMAETVMCTVRRDASYLNWKYVDQPGQEFLRLEVLDGDAPMAVVVWALREPDRAYAYRRALLVDLVAPLDNVARLAQAIDATIPVIADAGADAAICLHISETVTRALRECGFHLREPGRFLLVSPGPLQGAQRESVLSSSSWLVTQGDSDIDRPW